MVGGKRIEKRYVPTLPPVKKTRRKQAESEAA
jgi:hypothetical protein